MLRDDTIRGTLRSDNGNVHGDVAEKYTSHHFKVFKHFRLSQVTQLLKRTEFRLELKREDHTRVHGRLIYILCFFRSQVKLKFGHDFMS